MESQRRNGDCSW